MNKHSRESRAILRLAFLDSLPVLMGYSTMGFVAGVLLAAKGNVVLSPLWAFLSSTLWVTGTMSIAGVMAVVLQLWKRNPLLSIVAGTVIYMLLLNCL